MEELDIWSTILTYVLDFLAVDLEPSLIIFFIFCCIFERLRCERTEHFRQPNGNEQRRGGRPAMGFTADNSDSRTNYSEDLQGHHIYHPPPAEVVSEFLAVLRIINYEHTREVSQLKEHLNKMSSKYTREVSQLKEHLNKMSSKYTREVSQLKEHLKKMSSKYTREVLQLKEQSKKMSSKYTCEVSQLKEQLGKKNSEDTREVSQQKASDELTREVLQLKEQLAEEKNKDICAVCLDKKRDILLLPCNHYCVCRSCLPKLKCCPLCTRTIDSSESVYH